MSCIACPKVVFSWSSCAWNIHRLEARMVIVREHSANYTFSPRFFCPQKSNPLPFPFFTFFCSSLNTFQVTTLQRQQCHWLAIDRKVPRVNFLKDTFRFIIILGETPKKEMEFRLRWNINFRASLFLIYAMLHFSFFFFNSPFSFCFLPSSFPFPFLSFSLSRIVFENGCIWVGCTRTRFGRWEEALPKICEAQAAGALSPTSEGPLHGGTRPPNAVWYLS